MYTSSYSIEKVAAYNRHDALTASDQRRLAREVRRPDDTGTAPTGTRVPRRHLWSGLARPRTALSGR